MKEHQDKDDGQMKQNNPEEEMIKFQINGHQKQEFQNAFPWCSERTKKTIDPMLRMHNQTVQFYLFMTASEEEHQQNIQIFQKIKQSIESNLPNCEVIAPFISQKLYLRETEAQIFILIDSISNKNYQIVKNCAQLMGVVDIKNLSKQEEKYQTQAFSGNYTYQNGLKKGTLIIRMLPRQFSDFLSSIAESNSLAIELKFVYIVMACVLRQRGLHSRIKSYLLFGLIGVFYHERRKHRPRTLAENIIKFIEYYGVGPFQERKIVYLGRNKYELLQESNSPTPFSFWIGQKYSLSVIIVRELFAIAKNRYKIISNTNFIGEKSIIGMLVNPCQKIFSYL